MEAQSEVDKKEALDVILFDKARTFIDQLKDNMFLYVLSVVVMIASVVAWNLVKVAFLLAIKLPWMFIKGFNEHVLTLPLGTACHCRANGCRCNRH